MVSGARVEHYRRLNGKYLREAEELQAWKDFPQASEKFWGAAAEIIKTVAAKRGSTLGTHRSLADFVESLQQERPELDLGPRPWEPDGALNALLRSLWHRSSLVGLCASPTAGPAEPRATCRPKPTSEVGVPAEA
jgi:hypothetical protein